MLLWKSAGRSSRIVNLPAGLAQTTAQQFSVSWSTNTGTKGLS